MPGQQAISANRDGTFNALCGLCTTDPPAQHRTTVGTRFASSAEASAFLDRHARETHKYHEVVSVS